MRKHDYINSIAKIVRQNIDCDKKLTFLDIKEFLKGIGGYVSYNLNNSIYPVNIEKVGSTFVLRIDESLDDYSKVMFSLVEIGHLFLHFRYLDKDYYKNFWIDESSFFRYGRGLERAEAIKFADLVYNGL